MVIENGYDLGGCMAKKELAPHGSIGAVRRHQRAGDPLCEQCRVAWRDYRRERRNGQREDAGVMEGVPVSEVFELPSELEETRSNYRAVVTAMGSSSTPATALSSLSARREALYARLVVLEEQRMHRELIASVNDGDLADRKSTRLNSSHGAKSRMPSSA